MRGQVIFTIELVLGTVSLQSSRDGSLLTLGVIKRNGEEVEFEVTVHTPWFSGRAPASTYINGSPSSLFSEMASNWSGWNGTKSWRDLENRVIFNATSDHTGHISFRAELGGPDYESRLIAVIEFEAGQLESMAASVKGLLG